MRKFAINSVFRMVAFLTWLKKKNQNYRWPTGLVKGEKSQQTPMKTVICWISLSSRTVRRRLFNAEYKSYTTKRKPLRKPIQCSNRFRFAQEYSDWNFSDWKNVVFSDECHFEVFNRKIDLLYVVCHQNQANHFAFDPVFKVVAAPLASGELWLLKEWVH